MQPNKGAEAQKRKAPTNKAAKGVKKVGNAPIGGKMVKRATMKQTGKPKATKSLPVPGKMDMNGFRHTAKRGRPVSDHDDSDY